MASSKKLMDAFVFVRRVGASSSTTGNTSSFLSLVPSVKKLGYVNYQYYTSGHPFLKTRWEQIQKIEGEAELVVEEIDKVAVVAEKVSEKLAEALPENSKLQKTALVIDNMSKVVAADASSAEDVIHKVEVLKQDFQELEKALQHPVKQQ